MAKLSELDPNLALPSVSGDLVWYDIQAFGIEGRGWDDTATPYDRLPDRAQGVVRDPVWQLSQHSAGLCVRFVTDATSISARWKLRRNNLAMDHMPATGVSGLDLYAEQGGVWRWAGVGRPTKLPENEAVLAGDMRPGRRHYLLYLPLYNGVEAVAIGIPAGARLFKAPPYPRAAARPLCCYGTSILHGGCASRPGMAYPAILGRRLRRPVINLGFSGNGQAEPEVAALLAELEPAVYVLDPLPNLAPNLVQPRLVHMVKTIRAARPRTPIMLVENITYCNAWLVPSRAKRVSGANRALHEALRELHAGGCRGLHLVHGADLLGSDGLGTVDGTHPTDVGFLRMADLLEPLLRTLLE